MPRNDIRTQGPRRAVPCQRGPPIPFAERPEVKRLLDEYVGKGIMIPVTEASEWVAPFVFTRKPDGSLRFCVDHTKLNRHVRQPTHPTRTPRDDVAEIAKDARFFTTFDAANGYFQIPLHPSSQHLTIFITPWGIYKFLRASIGLCSSSFEYNRRADVAFHSVPYTMLEEMNGGATGWGSGLSS